MISAFNESIDLENSYEYQWLDTPIEGELDGDKYTTYPATFLDKNNRKYYVEITFFHYNPDMFTVDFQDEKCRLKDQQENKNILNSTHVNTNRFDAFKVLATVFKIVKDYTEDNKLVDGFVFNADEKRRHIYKEIIAKKFPKWYLEKDEKRGDKWYIQYNKLVRETKKITTSFEMFNENLVNAEIIRIAPYSCKGEPTPITFNTRVAAYLKEKNINDIRSGKKPITYDLRQDFIKIFGKPDPMIKFEFRTCLWYLGYKDLKFAVYTSANKTTNIELFLYKLHCKRYEDIIEFVNKLSDLINKPVI